MIKNPPANTGDTGSIPGSGRSPGEGTMATNLKKSGYLSVDECASKLVYTDIKGTRTHHPKLCLFEMSYFSLINLK